MNIQDYVVQLSFGIAFIILVIGVYYRIKSTSRKTRPLEVFEYNVEKIKVEVYKPVSTEDHIEKIFGNGPENSHIKQKARAIRNLYKSLTAVENSIKPLLEKRSDDVHFTKETRRQIENEAIESLKHYYLTAKNEYVFTSEKYSRLIDLVCISFYKMSEDFYNYKYLNDDRSLGKTWDVIQRYIPVLKSKLEHEYRFLLRQQKGKQAPHVIVNKKKLHDVVHTF